MWIQWIWKQEFGIRENYGVDKVGTIEISFCHIITVLNTGKDVKGTLN